MGTTKNKGVEQSFGNKADKLQASINEHKYGGIKKFHILGSYRDS